MMEGKKKVASLFSLRCDVDFVVCGLIQEFKQIQDERKIIIKLR